jgi:uncharacterized protein DUF1801
LNAPGDFDPVPPIPDEVCAVFDAAPADARLLAYELRALIYKVASRAEAVPGLSESLKWGEPSYTPSKPRVGSSIRIKPREDGSVGLMFICHTDIVARFRELYANRFEFEGNRAILIKSAGYDEDALCHCIAMTLTWHLDNRV